MREWGWTNPVLIDDDGGIIAGHGRVMAARTLGYTEAPVMVADGWSDEQRRAYVLADNQLALNAGWDDDLLRFELDALGAAGFDLDLIGFDNIDALLANQGRHRSGRCAGAAGQPGVGARRCLAARAASAGLRRQHRRGRGRGGAGRREAASDGDRSAVWG